MVHHMFDTASRRRTRHDHETHIDDETRVGYDLPSIDEMLASLNHPKDHAPARARPLVGDWGAWEEEDDCDCDDEFLHDDPVPTCPPEVPSCSDCKWCSDPDGDVEGCVVVRIASALEDIAMVLGHISSR